MFWIDFHSFHSCRSEALEVGDLILAVNGTGTRHLRHQEVVNLLHHAGGVVSLEIEYELAPDGKESAEFTYPSFKKHCSFRLQRRASHMGLIFIL